MHALKNEKCRQLQEQGAVQCHRLHETFCNAHLTARDTTSGWIMRRCCTLLSSPAPLDVAFGMLMLLERERDLSMAAEGEEEPSAGICAVSTLHIK
jgi:hypothetical protein